MSLVYGGRADSAVLAQSLLIMVLGAAAADAQTVEGRVTEDGRDVSVEGAMVVLLHADEPVARQLTAADGAYRLRAPGPGLFALRIDRIGYGSTYVDEVRIPAEGTVRADVAVSVQAVALRGLDVSGASRCQSDPGSARGATAVVWEEARKALEAARWTADREMYRFSWRRHVRELDASGRRVESEALDRKRSWAPRPFVALDPQRLADEGFVREETGDAATYYAPDADVLLSSAFLDTHCFSLRTDVVDDDGRRLVGLAFRPVPGRRVPDVQGVLWLEEEGARLRAVEYEYVLRRKLAVTGSDAHGALEFHGLPNGTWVVNGWWIRMPRLAEVRDGTGMPSHYDVRGYLEEGAVVNEIARQDGTIVARPGLPGIHGVVTDSAGTPVLGARVEIVGTGRTTTTDAHGAFEISDLGPGVWSLRLTHPALEAWGESAVEVDTEVGGTHGATPSLTLPSLLDIALRACGSPAEPGSTHILGRIPGHRGGAQAAVRLRWSEPVGALGSRLTGLATNPDAQGRFQFCSVPADEHLLVDRAGDVEGFAALRVPTDALAATVELPAPDVSPVTAGDPDIPAPGSDPDGVSWAGPEPPGPVPGWVEATGFVRRAPRALLRAGPHELRAARVASLTELFQQIPRVEVRRRGMAGTELRLHPEDGWRDEGRPDESCLLEPYLNGSRLRPRSAGDWQFHTAIQPADVAGIEVFDAADAPVGDANACGVILLWVEPLRDRDDPPFLGWIEGRIQRDGLPVAGTPVRLRPDGQEVLTDKEGRFEMGAVPPTRYTLEADVPGWGTWRMEVDVRAGATTDAGIHVDGPG